MSTKDIQRLTLLSSVLVGSLALTLQVPVYAATPAKKAPVTKKVTAKKVTAKKVASKKAVHKKAAASHLPTATGVTLAQQVPHLLQVDNRIKAAWNDLEADRFKIHKAVGDWLPKFDVTLGEGRQRRSTTTENTDYATNDQKFEVKQLIYDFGETMSGIKTAEDTYKKSRVNYSGVRQDTMLDGASAYLKLLGAYQTLSYSKRYEQNVAKQVRMEQIKRRRGSGYSTDVLEASAQLSGAKAQVTQAQGALVNAENAYKRTFHEMPAHLNEYKIPVLPTASIPKTEDEALAVAERENTDIAKLKYDIKIDREAITAAGAKFAPAINLKSSDDFQHNVSGVVGQKKEWTTEVELTYPLINGGSDMAALKSAQYSLDADQQRLDDQRRVTEEEIRDDWDSWQTSLENAVYLKKQSSQLSQFVKLAGKERQMGRKTLLEVLVADTNYINAVKSSVEAEVNVAVETYTLLRHMGVLNEQMFVSPKKSQHFEKAVNARISKRDAAKQKAAAAARTKGPTAKTPTAKAPVAVKTTSGNTKINAKPQAWHRYTRPVSKPAKAKVEPVKHSRMKMRRDIHAKHALSKSFDWI